MAEEKARERGREREEGGMSLAAFAASSSSFGGSSALWSPRDGDERRKEGRKKASRVVPPPPPGAGGQESALKTGNGRGTTNGVWAGGGEKDVMEDACLRGGEKAQSVRPPHSKYRRGPTMYVHATL